MENSQASERMNQSLTSPLTGSVCTRHLSVRNTLDVLKLEPMQTTKQPSLLHLDISVMMVTHSLFGQTHIIIQFPLSTEPLQQ
jgi:mRNA degradation ribonuclease J1/J2